MAATMEDFKKYKSKYQVAKSNCTKAIKRLDAALADFSKNNAPEMSPMRKMRFAATLMEVVDFSKSKVQEMEKIVSKFVEVITDLDESSFTDPNKETLLQKIQVEQEEYEDKHEEILKKNDQVIFEAETILSGTKDAQQVVVLPEETTGVK